MKNSSRIRLSLILALLVLTGLSLAPGAQAAPAPHAAPSVIHDYVVTLTERALTVQAYLRISPELAPEVYRLIDTDNDGRTSDAEYNAWYYQHPNRLGLALNGTAVHPQVSTPAPISREDLLVSIQYPIVVTYTWASPAPLAGKHRIQLTYGDNYLSYDEYYISVAGDLANDGKPDNVSLATYPATYQVVYHIPAPGEAANTAAAQLAAAPWTMIAAQPLPVAPPEAPAVNAGAAPGPAAVAPGAGPTGQILDGLRAWRGELWSGLGMLLLALALGALHALTPGHGKAMVAAYLVGSRGRVWDAVLLGGVVTVTHTIGVVALGLALWLVSAFSLPRALQPALELASGALVVGLGLWLLVSRWRALRSVSGPARAARRAVAPAPVAVGAGAATAALPATGLPVRRVAAPALAAPDHVHHVHVHHGHDHTHDHAHDHDHVHPPDQAHGHSHGGHEHTHGPVRVDSVRALVGLGISGGLVPCPDALAILLLAASVGQVALGLGLVVSFSAGLAVVLIGIGIALVLMKGTLERRNLGGLRTNPLWTRWVPLASAAVVTLVGLLMLLSALGARWS